MEPRIRQMNHRAFGRPVIIYDIGNQFLFSMRCHRNKKGKIRILILNIYITKLYSEMDINHTGEKMIGSSFYHLGYSCVVISRHLASP